MSIRKLLPFQRGIGLIEVLIAVVVMSVGFLAAARMQVEGMRFSQSAYYQSQAYFLANDMIDRMRSNIPGVLANDYNSFETVKNPSPASCTGECTPSEIAALDLYEWSVNLHGSPSQNIPAALEGGSGDATGTVIVVDSLQSQYAIELTWYESISGTDTEQNLRIDFELETRGI